MTAPPNTYAIDANGHVRVATMEEFHRARKLSGDLMDAERAAPPFDGTEPNTERYRLIKRARAQALRREDVRT